MSFDEYKEGVRKRRHERLHLLKKKQRLYSPPIASPSQHYPTYAEDHQDTYFSSYSYPENGESQRDVNIAPLLFKIVISFILLASVYIIMQSNHPQFTQAQIIVKDVMEREFNVKGVIGWYEKNVGAAPDFLPQLVKRENKAQDIPWATYAIPVSGGKVVAAFGQDHRGIRVGTAKMVPIEAVKEGWVISVEEREGLGKTIVIDHGNGEESWYGQTENIKVKVNDWIQQGQVIGSTSVEVENGEGVFFFALKKDSNFINPMEVLPFD
jgi:stage IV sporulation protein FA